MIVLDKELNIIQEINIFDSVEGELYKKNNYVFNQRVVNMWDNNYYFDDTYLLYTYENEYDSLCPDPCMICPTTYRVGKGSYLKITATDKNTCNPNIYFVRLSSYEPKIENETNVKGETVEENPKTGVYNLLILLIPLGLLTYITIYVNSKKNILKNL